MCLFSSLLAAVFATAGLSVPWYGHAVGYDFCEIVYSLLSYGWLGAKCTADTKTNFPQFGTMNIIDVDNSNILSGAAIMVACGLFCGLLAVASSYFQRAAELTLGSEAPKPPYQCGSACAMLWCTVGCFAGIVLGAIAGGARFEQLANGKAVQFDFFGGGRSVMDVAVAAAACALLCALLLKLRLRAHAQAAKREEDRRRAERLLGLPAYPTSRCC